MNTVDWEKLQKADLDASTRQMIRMRQNDKCFYCGEPIEGHKYVLDHFIPRSKGGVDDHFNRVAAHSRCDGLKRDRMPHADEILKQMELLSVSR